MLRAAGRARGARGGARPSARASGARARLSIAEGLLDRLRARGFVAPDYGGRGLANVPSTVLDILGARDASDLVPLADLDPSLSGGVRVVVVILVDGLGWRQLERLCSGGTTPFLRSVVERARRRDGAQLLSVTSVFPSTTAAAITTLNTAATPQEHGNIAYFLWLEEFAAVTQMLRWGKAELRTSYFDDPEVDPRRYVRVPSIHARLRERGAISYVIEPEIFRGMAMERMHAAEAEFIGYPINSTMGVRLKQILERRPWADRPAYVYAYWDGVDYVSHRLGPNGPEHDAEAAALDLALGRALEGRSGGDVLVLLTSDHGQATVDPAKFIDLHDDVDLVRLLSRPLAGEPRLAFFHTDRPSDVAAHLEQAYPGWFFTFSREEALAAGLFGRGDAALVNRRVGDLVGMLDADHAASLVSVAGVPLRQRGSHGGMTADEMRVPLLAWRC